MNLKFECSKQELRDALEKFGFSNYPLKNNKDISEATVLLMEALEIEHTRDEGTLLVPRQCEINDDKVIIGLGPGTVLILFGPPNDITTGDKKWMLQKFNILKDAVIR